MSIVLFFLCSCVLPYGEPLVSHIAADVPEENVDFSELEARLDGLLLTETDRKTAVHLQELERLLIKAKSWEREAQQDVFHFASQFLAEFQEEDAHLPSEAEVEEMELILAVVPLEEEPVQYKSNERIDKAKELVEAGKRKEALALLEEYKGQLCWSDVYVYWAECADAELSDQIANIQSQQLSPEEEIILWRELKAGFSHPQHVKRIEKGLIRLQGIIDNP